MTLPHLRDALVIPQSRYAALRLDRLFPSSQGVPTDLEMENMLQKTSMNLELVWQYVSARLLAIRLVLDCLRLGLGRAACDLYLSSTPGTVVLKAVDDAIDPAWLSM